MAQINSISCLTWVPRGVAKQIPDKVNITKDQLKILIDEAKEDLDNLDDLKEDDYSALEVEAQESDLKIFNNKENVETQTSVNNDGARSNSVEMEYNFDTYDEESEGLDSLLKLGKLTMFADPEDDPLIIIKEDVDESEKDDEEILPTDNLIAAGHVDGDCITLEVYIFNSGEGSLFIHHDINLASVPFSMEFLDFDPVDESQLPGNMLAIGSLSPVIEVWDLNLVDAQKPAFKLGKKAKKKKKIAAEGHTDAVLCLGWNRELHHILASGSCDNTVILWDLQEQREAQRITAFKNKVQDLKWHSSGKQLLTGSSDRFLRLTDCVSNETKSWDLDGEIECVSWGNCQQSNNIYASTDSGTLYCYDTRNSKKPLWKINAHNKSCTNIAFSSYCPGCLITVSEDESVKIWDVLNEKPELIHEKNAKLGVIYNVSFSPDDPFIIAMGGDNRMNNFKVWNIRNSKKVRRRFCERVNLPVDEDGDDDDKEGDEIEVNESSDEEMEFETVEAAGISSKAKSKGNFQAMKPPLKKSMKKKGGHIDKKKKK